MGMPGFETSSAECVEGSLVMEVLREIHEDKDFADTGMDHEDRNLVTSKVEWHDGIILFRVDIIGLQGVNVVGQTRDHRVLEI